MIITLVRHVFDFSEEPGAVLWRTIQFDQST